MIKKISLVYFSPSKTTKRVIGAIANGINAAEIQHLDITTNDIEYIASMNELVVFGIPVHAGRLPAIATNRLRKIIGSNSPAIIVVVYGNRDYEDALIELKDLVINQGFNPFVAAVFIGEHSFSTEYYPIAKGRPDKNDLSIANDLGAKIQLVLNGLEMPVGQIIVKGNFPYKAILDKPNISATTDITKCLKCGICVSSCPVGSIHSINNVPETDVTTCILCCACVKECPNNARNNDNDFINQRRDFLVKNFMTRKEPEIFMLNEC